MAKITAFCLQHFHCAGIFNAFGSYTGLSGSLEKFDKVEEQAQNTNQVKQSDLQAGNKLVDQLEGLLESFKKASASYTAVLGKSIDKEIDKRSEQDVKTTYEKALKFLMKQLKAIEETGDSRVASLRQRFDEAEKDLSVKEKMLINWKKNMNAALARGVAAAAKVKADPTVATYNSIFPKAARDITMQLVFAKDLDGFLADPAEILKDMNPWASQAGTPPAALPDTATETHVKAFLNGFIKELKRAQQLAATKDVY